MPLTLSEAAAGRSTAHPLLALLARPNPREGGQRFLESALRAPAGLRQRLCRGGAASTARRASSTRCGPTGCAWCPAPTAGRRPTNTRSARRRCASPTAGRRAGRRSCTSRCSIRSTTITASRRWRRRRSRSTSTTPPAPGTRRCSTTRRGPPARWSMPGRRDAALRRAVRAAQGRAGGELPGRAPTPAGRCCSKAGSTGSRCRSRPRTWTFVEAKSRRRARDRARLRRAADAARHPRRQHLCQLRRGQPRLLPPDRAAARAPHRRGAGRTGCAGLRRDALRSNPTSTPSRRWRPSARALWRRVSAADFLSDDEKREAVGYGRIPRLSQEERSSAAGGGDRVRGEP